MPTLPRVAIKLHQLAPGWPDARKASYVRHAVREYSIHRSLRHERVVALREIFEVDSDAFATVLDYCPGGDLDAHLRSHGALPEREARAIAAQVFGGLAYLNAPPRRVIHYDLKPANILFDGAGSVKLTDFGLSKVVEDGHTRGLELTSQGAGTYWYLPPECFETGGPTPPLITNKVDVWAAGVILYQMLFGRRPWGEGRSQEALLRDGVMLTATRGLDFPPKPAVSTEAKAFLAACLAYRPADRLDVHAGGGGVGVWVGEIGTEMQKRETMR
jgi:tousled-like kinase